MAARAVEREPRRRVIGGRRRGVVLLVALDAARGGHEGRFAVAPLASDHAMIGVELRAGLAAVIPSNRVPRRRAVALLALRAQTQLIPIVLSTSPVAVETGARRRAVLSVQMALLARDGEMA